MLYYKKDFQIISTLNGTEKDEKNDSRGGNFCNFFFTEFICKESSFYSNSGPAAKN